MLRKARVTDVPQIHDILTHFGGLGLLLPRSRHELYESIRDHFVWQEDERVVGVSGMHVCWEDLAEVRSLAVIEDFQGRSMGLKLVNACLEEAVTLGLFRIFTLSYVPEFFTRFGFVEVDKSVLPHPVWADCVKCVKFPDCGETAMMLEL
ncbi:MAG: N-acetyltransferase [Proteobacteria bacterium]|nr:N-acetyltransferase [Pseudomonadota bacterium]